MGRPLRTENRSRPTDLKKGATGGSIIAAVGQFHSVLMSQPSGETRWDDSCDSDCIKNMSSMSIGFKTDPELLIMIFELRIKTNRNFHDRK